ncbi:hypothetical protein, partial [Aquitalea magnusonii]|uniref:hypothetical protein n=1 Tax=Aquitalea magnusonii TaxID=332411 RepID=UPI00195D3BD2
PRVRGSIPRLATRIHAKAKLNAWLFALLQPAAVENPRVRGSIPRLATRIHAKAKLNAWLFALLQPAAV